MLHDIAVILVTFSLLLLIGKKSAIIAISTRTDPISPKLDINQRRSCLLQGGDWVLDIDKKTPCCSQCFSKCRNVITCSLTKPFTKCQPFCYQKNIRREVYDLCERLSCYK